MKEKWAQYKNRNWKRRYILNIVYVQCSWVMSRKNSDFWFDFVVSVFGVFSRRCFECLIWFNFLRGESGEHRTHFIKQNTPRPMSKSNNQKQANWGPNRRLGIFQTKYHMKVSNNHINSIWMHFVILNGNYRLQFYNVIHNAFNIQCTMYIGDVFYKQNICPFVHPSIKITKFANYSSEFYAFIHNSQNTKFFEYILWNMEYWPFS